jgi:hypothetical protein
MPRAMQREPSRLRAPLTMPTLATA